MGLKAIDGAIVYSPMPVKIATATASFRAPALSEDRLAVHQHAGGVVVVVADGAGGIPGGAKAADLAMEVVAEAVQRATFDRLDIKALSDVLLRADEIIDADPMAGETTCVVVAISEDGQVVGASVGDSGALIVGPNAAVDDLTRQQHRKRRLGSGRAAPVPFERAAFEGTLVVATDGLLNYARPEVVARVVMEHPGLDEAAQALVQTVRLPSGDLVDDVVLVLVRCGCHRRSGRAQVAAASGPTRDGSASLARRRRGPSSAEGLMSR